MVGWSNATLPNSERGLGVRNLKLAKVALIAKIVFKTLNDRDCIWVNILKMNYGKFSLWDQNLPRHCSLFYRSLSRTVDFIKPKFGLKLLTLMILVSCMTPGALKFLCSKNL